MFIKIGGLKNFAIFIGKHICWKIFQYYQDFSWCCKILKKTFFKRTPPLAASEIWMTLKNRPQLFFWTAFWISVFTLQFCSKNLTYTVNPYFVYKISSKLTKEVITIFNNLVLAFFLLTLNNLTKAPKKLPTIPVIIGGHCFRKIRSDHNSNIYKNCYW